MKLSRVDDVTVNLSATVSGRTNNLFSTQSILDKTGNRFLLIGGSRDFGYLEGKKVLLDFDDDGYHFKIEASK